MYLSNHVRVSHGLHGLLKRVFFLSFFHIYQPTNMRRWDLDYDIQDGGHVFLNRSLKINISRS